MYMVLTALSRSSVRSLSCKTSATTPSIPTCIQWLAAEGSEDANDKGAALATGACDPDLAHVSCYLAGILVRISILYMFGPFGGFGW